MIAKTKTKTKTKRPRKSAEPKPSLRRAAYEQALRRNLDELLELMKKTWGFRPDLAVAVEPALIVRVHFNLKGFAHKGAKYYVSAAAARQHRRPARVARMIAGELSGHRNTCRECGEGIPAIWERLARSSWRHYGDPAALDLPADPVERKVHPRLARRLDKRLEARLRETELLEKALRNAAAAAQKGAP